MTIIKTYSKMIALTTYEERFRYLKLGGTVGEETFGCHRYLNQIFYKSPEWKRVRDIVIIRDSGCDLGCLDREIRGQKVLIHHIEPITLADIQNRSEKLLDPENLITVTKRTHNAIHYGDESILMATMPIERTPNDTCPWRR